MIFNKKNKLTKIMAATMAAVILAGSPIQTLAADKQKTKYIKEIRMFENKEDITGDYTAIKNRDGEVADFNEGTGKNAVYLGYSTTTDASQAIRDIAVMDMKGGYSFAEYEKVLEKKKKDIKSYLDDLKSAIKKFKQNYQKKDALALEGYKILNRYKDGDPDDPYAGTGDAKDTGKLIGDLLLSDNVSDDKLIKIFMESYSGLSCNVMTAIGMGIANEAESNFMERFSKNLSKDYKNVSTETEDKARQLVDLANAISKNIQQYEEVEWDIDKDSTKDEIQKELEDGLDEMSDQKKNKYITQTGLYTALASYSNGDHKNETLVDFFRDGDLKAKDLYPLAEAMSKEQVTLASHTGLGVMIESIGITKKELNKAKSAMDSEQLYKDMQKEVLGNTEAVSIYEGVDRAIYSTGVALTNKALREQAATEDNKNPLWGNTSRTKEIAILASLGASVTVAVATYAFMEWAASSGRLYIGKKAIVDAFDVIDGVILEENVYAKTFSQVFKRFLGKSVSTAETTAHVASGQFTAWSIIPIANVVSTAVSVGMLAWYITEELYNYYNPTMSTKPAIIMDTYEDEDGESLIKYNAVLKADSTEIGDLNYGNNKSSKGKQWNVLYTTTDKKAGDPILADDGKELNLIMVTGNERKEKAVSDTYEPVHYFGKTVAFNLNTHARSDEENGVFAYVRREDKKENSADTTSSIFATPTNISIIIIVLIAGLAVGFAGGYGVKGRKKKKQLAKQK